MKIDNGRLDIDYLATIVKDKRHFYREINILQKALNQAKVNITVEPTKDVNIPVYFHHTDEKYSFLFKRSNYFYNHLIEEIRTPPTSEVYWINTTGLRVTDQHLYKSYVRKIKLLKDKKLAETNFKILNNILPCNRNLYKWGKSDTDMCYFCQEQESISHLLFYCTRVKPIWEIASNVLLYDESISHDVVIFGYDADAVLNHVCSIIVYFIYKEWLICSLENRQRKQHVCFKYFINYLSIRRNIYLKCSHTIWVDVCIKLANLTTHIEDSVCV